MAIIDLLKYLRERLKSRKAITGMLVMSIALLFVLMSLVINGFSPDNALFSKLDQKLYKNIFAAQSRGNWQEADKEMAKLGNKDLLGSVKAGRILSSSYKASNEEIAEWLENYSDHPQAEKVYRKAKSIAPEVASKFKGMERTYLSGYGDNNGLSGRIESVIDSSSWKGRPIAEYEWKTLNNLIHKEKITKARNQLDSIIIKGLFNPNEVAVLKWNMASAYFAAGKDKEAFKFSSEVAEQHGKQMPGVYWTAGISAWRIGNVAKAAEYFSKMAETRDMSDWEKSSAAFWAYRAYKEKDDESAADEMIARAASYPHTFYGILASQAVNDELNFSWDKDDLSNGDINDLKDIPAVRRALAFAELGMDREAESELRNYYPQADIAEKGKLILLAEKLDMTALQVRMASTLKKHDNDAHDYAYYPVPRWQPKDGFKIEPALVFALMRHESGFNPEAVSKAGAVGLMQLMPQTAKYITAKNDLKITSKDLLTPDINLEVAQEYISYLLKNEGIGKNMFLVAAAYNAGPGKVSSWLKKVKYNKDPLLFIESIPSNETRNFIEQVMANYWIYSERLDGGSRTIEMVLDGNWPLHASLIQETPVQLSQLN